MSADALHLDARGQACGATLVKLAQLARVVAPDAELVVDSDDPAAAAELASWCRMTGHRYLGAAPPGGHLLRLNPTGGR